MASKWFSVRGKGPLWLIVVGALIAAALFIGFDSLATYTERNEFCTSCHTMGTNFVEYQGTVHFQNRPGVQAGCSDCHVAEKGAALLWDKIVASKDVLYHLAGTINTPAKFEQRREQMANVVWKKMVATDSRECRSCHSFANMDLLAQRSGARRYHAIAMKEKTTCIECHKGIAHFLPATDESGAGAAKLADAAKAVPADAKQLFAIQTTSFYLAAAEQDPNQGKLMPSAPVERIGQEGARYKVKVAGWRQEGVDKIVYFAPGKRIVNAALSQETATKLSAGKSLTDEATGQKWTEASIEGWVEKSAFVDKDAVLWAYGKELMTTNCATCHGEPDLHHFTANQWIGVIQSMATRSSMDLEQTRLLTQYSQKHGSDMEPAGK